MKITTISATAGCKFPHPFETFANQLVSVTLSATLSETDKPERCIAKLQESAEFFAAQEKQRIQARWDAQPQWSTHNKARAATEATGDALAQKHGVR